MVAEMADPRCVEGRPVPLQVAHEDADPHDIGQARAGRGEDGGQVSEDLVRLLACLSRPCTGLPSAVSITLTTPDSGFWAVGRCEYD